jgi:hypothetical protein
MCYVVVSHRQNHIYQKSNTRKKIIVTNCTIRTVKGVDVGGGGGGRWGFPNTLLSRAPALIEEILMTPFLAARELVELWEHIIEFFVRSAENNGFFQINRLFMCHLKGKSGRITQNGMTVFPFVYVLVLTSTVTCLIFYF